jgi:hypothetical protein
MGRAGLVFFEPPGDELGDFTGFGVACGAKLRVDQFTLEADLEPPPIRGDQTYPGQIGFEVLQQFGRQTDGAIGVVSDSAVDDFNIEHGMLRFPGCPRVYHAQRP